MALRQILRFPDNRLRQKSTEVTAFDEDLRRLVTDMGETMYASNGAGLAAIQVGAPLRLFIVDGEVAGGAEGSPPQVFINPEIVELSPESQTGDEGCLSFPGIYVPVKRGLRAKVRALDIEGNPFEKEGAELFARALQHETDHLNGRLLIDQVGPVKREIIKRKLRKDAEAEAEEAASADGARGVG
ncbi:MAG TPA: peptide deformylase [Polyangia bacterium]|nr:peptide deformylase [Polyangia bacterium]